MSHPWQLQQVAQIKHQCLGDHAATNIMAGAEVKSFRQKHCSLNLFFDDHEIQSCNVCALSLWIKEWKISQHTRSMFSSVTPFLSGSQQLHLGLDLPTHCLQINHGAIYGAQTLPPSLFSLYSLLALPNGHLGCMCSPRTAVPLSLGSRKTWGMVHIVHKCALLQSPARVIKDRAEH